MAATEERMSVRDDSVAATKTHVESFPGNPDDPYAVLSARKRHIAGLYNEQRITPAEALRLAMYVTHGVEATRDERELRMEYMSRLLRAAEPGQPALAHSLQTFAGGMLDGPLGMRVETQEQIHFIMEVPFAQLPGEPRITDIRLAHMLIGGMPRQPQSFAVGDYLYVGSGEIAAFVQARSFATLRDNSEHPYLEAERDGRFLTGLYEAGITLAECGIDRLTRDAVYAKMDTRLGAAACRALPQALHVVAMEHLT